MLVRRFRLASNRYIIHENANVKECQYQVMISNDLFEETNKNIFFLKYFTINYVLNFLYIIFNKNSSMKNFSLKKYIIAKQKLKIL